MTLLVSSLRTIHAIRRRAALSALVCCAAALLTLASPLAQALKAAPTLVQPAPAPSGLAVDAQQRVAALEASLGQLRSDARATQALMAGLQVRLAEAQAATHAPDTLAVYPLTWVAALLTLSTLALARLLWRESRHSTLAWWLAPSNEPAGAPQRAGAEGSLPVPVPSSVRPVWPPHLPDRPPLTRVASLAPAQDGPLAQTDAEPAPMPPFQLGAGPGAMQDDLLEAGAIGPASRMSSQALIDLEQHVDFFVALGEDESAIELLMGLVRSDSGSSAMPYLKLLEIYRRRGETEAYERIQERVSRRFNAAPPTGSSGSLAAQLPVAVAVAVAIAVPLPQTASAAMVDLLLPFGAQRAPFLFSDFAPVGVDLDLSDSLVAATATPPGACLPARTAKTRDHGTSAVER